ncbi:MAG: type III toxin-antitoxin system ToxN/AbiQ family toxin [Lachnospiraceae bacterium]|nr:type III toxin-antitoxin system ToxN/AbiQ family toxin [Lachnospiraceae bacterium]
MDKKDDIRFYEIDPKYIDYLLPYAPHLYGNKQPGQNNERKYIEEGLDFIRVKNYAVINLNNMIPVPMMVCKQVDFSKERNTKYRDLLRAEYRYIKMIRERIWKNARLLYNHKIKNGNSTPLAKRCNDFVLLEEKSREYKID